MNGTGGLGTKLDDAAGIIDEEDAPWLMIGDVDAAGTKELSELSSGNASYTEWEDDEYDVS